MKTVIKMVSSGLYIGYSPMAPGTLGSLWAILIYLQLKDYPTIYILAVALLFILGFLISTPAEKIFGRKDSPKIVVDEIASLCFVYLFIKPTAFMLASGFIIFRIFDIIKPPPARKIQLFSGSRGIMLDDFVAACYTIIAMGLLQKFCL